MECVFSVWELYAPACSTGKYDIIEIQIKLFDIVVYEPQLNIPIIQIDIHLPPSSLPNDSFVSYHLPILIL